MKTTKKSSPKVSVLMPAYNVEKYVGEAIESILNQTFTDFEFIIINDGSTDDTAKIIKEYAKRDKRIKFIDNKKNQGLITVLNQGLDLCSGEYIARFDSDDISMPERFAKQVEYLDKYNEVGVLGTSVITFGNDNRTLIKKSKCTYFDVLYMCPVAHPSVMIRKSVLDKYNIKYDINYKTAEDYKLWSELIKATQIHNLQDVLLKYRVHSTSISCSNSDIQNNTSDIIRKDMIEYLTDIPEFIRICKKISHNCQFYDKSMLSKHMLIHHPFRWLRLKVSK